MKQYVALHSVQLNNADGERVAVEPLDEAKGHSGLFEADYPAKMEKRLIDTGVIRLPIKLEVYDEPSPVEELADTRVVKTEADDAAAVLAANAAAAAAAADVAKETSKYEATPPAEKPAKAAVHKPLTAAERKAEKAAAEKAALEDKTGAKDAKGANPFED